ncbi:hypothetical protein EMCRGX_G021451 [Ephydatia muelleri]
MENYILYGEHFSDQDGTIVYKGRRRGTVSYVNIRKHPKERKDVVSKEVSLLQNLDHSNVVKFLEWYETSNHLWVITELVQASTLAEILDQDGFIPLGELPAFLVDIAAGLNFVHATGLIYCNLRPTNILLDSCQCLKLGDFSLACTAEGETVLAGGAQFTFSSDLWSLGCVLFEMCTGFAPFEAGSVEEALHKVCYEPPPSLRSEIVTRNGGGNLGNLEGVSEVVYLVSHLLQKEPDQRLSWEHFWELPLLRGSNLC